MKVVEETHTKLTLKKGRLGRFSIFSSIGGSIFALLGVALAISGNFTRLSCNRIEPNIGNCQLVESGLLGREERRIRIPLNEFQGAKVETTSHGGGHGGVESITTYRVLILTNKGEEPLNYGDSNFDEKQAIVSRINSFVGNPEQEFLIINQDTRWEMFMNGGSLVAFLFIIMVDASVITCTLDKTLNSFTLKRESLFDTKVIQHQIQEIKDVELELDGDGCSRISLILVSGKRIPLTYSYTNYGNKEKAVQCIRKFLNR